MPIEQEAKPICLLFGQRVVREGEATTELTLTRLQGRGLEEGHRCRPMMGEWSHHESTASRSGQLSTIRRPCAAWSSSA